MWPGNCLGPGKRPSPVGGGSGDSEREIDDEEDEDDFQPDSWTTAEIVAELVYHKVPLAQIASLDDIQMRWLYFRDRDKFGRLKRARREDGPHRDRSGRLYDDKGIPIPEKPVTFEEMYKSTKKIHGWDDVKVEEAWQNYLRKNPKLRERIEARKGLS